jgi:hypothetical protein
VLAHAGIVSGSGEEVRNAFTTFFDVFM